MGVGEEGESEDNNENQGDTDFLPDRDILIHTLTPTPLKNTITRCRIKFCIQHSFTSEYQQEILESAADFSYVAACPVLSSDVKYSTDSLKTGD